MQYGLSVRMISKLKERAAQVRFEVTSMISDHITRHKVHLPFNYELSFDRQLTSKID